MIPRKSPRFAVQLPIRFGENGREDSGTILNISQDGCMLTAGRIPDTATYLQLDMQIIEGEPPIRVGLAAVRWSSKHQFGVEYIKLDSDEGGRLRHFMKMLERSSVDR